MIVRVPHRPTGGVLSRFLAIRSVDSPHVSVRPFAPGIVFHYLKQNPVLETGVRKDATPLNSSARETTLVSRESEAKENENSSIFPREALHIGELVDASKAATYSGNVRIIDVPLLMRMLLLLVAGDSR